MRTRRIIGNYGENLACEYLKNNNYLILDRNFYFHHREIDIIAKDLYANEITFVEVKTRSNSKFGSPVDSVDNNKIRHLLSACRYYLYKNHLLNSFVRIDVIEVFINGKDYEINHIKQVI